MDTHTHTNARTRIPLLITGREPGGAVARRLLFAGPSGAQTPPDARLLGGGSSGCKGRRLVHGAAVAGVSLAAVRQPLTLASLLVCWWASSLACRMSHVPHSRTNPARRCARTKTAPAWRLNELQGGWQCLRFPSPPRTHVGAPRGCRTCSTSASSFGAACDAAAAPCRRQVIRLQHLAGANEFDTAADPLCAPGVRPHLPVARGGVRAVPAGRTPLPPPLRRHTGLRT
jgi:hypothetical protein